LNTIQISQNLKFNKKQTIKYVLRALPNEISGGIATSLIFSAWNAAIYVNQMDDDKVMNAEKKSNYEKIVKNIVAKKLGISTEVGKGYRALANISDHGGQEVPHLHFHLFGGERVGKMVE